MNFGKHSIIFVLLGLLSLSAGVHATIQNTPARALSKENKKLMVGAPNQCRDEDKEKIVLNSLIKLWNRGAISPIKIKKHQILSCTTQVVAGGLYKFSIKLDNQECFFNILVFMNSITMFDAEKTLKTCSSIIRDSFKSIVEGNENFGKGKSVDIVVPEAVKEQTILPISQPIQPQSDLDMPAFEPEQYQEPEREVARVENRKKRWDYVDQIISGNEGAQKVGEVLRSLHSQGIFKDLATLGYAEPNYFEKRGSDTLAINFKFKNKSYFFYAEKKSSGSHWSIVNQEEIADKLAPLFAEGYNPKGHNRIRI